MLAKQRAGSEARVTILFDNFSVLHDRLDLKI